LAPPIKISTGFAPETGVCHSPTINGKDRAFPMTVKRGRKSAAELAIAPVAHVIERPEPPYSLWRDAEADLFRQIVADLPPGWIGPRNSDLLAEYASHVVACQRLRQMIHAHESGGEAFDATEWRALMRAHAQQSARVQSLATALRITPQATLDPKAGGRALAKHQTGRKPWE
jgi:hypothetical protein